MISIRNLFTQDNSSAVASGGSVGNLINILRS